MKVNVTQTNKTMVSLHSLEPGEGFLSPNDGYPCIVTDTEYAARAVSAFNLVTFKICGFHEMQQVQISEISVEYTAG